MLARLIVRFYRDKIVTSLIWRENEWYHSCFLLIRSATLLGFVVDLFRFRISCFSMDYTYFLSIRSFLLRKRHEPKGVEEVPTSCIWCQLPFSWRFFRFLCMLFFLKRLTRKSSVLTIYHDISRYITIYRDIISQLIELTYRDKIVDFVAI